MIQELLGGGGLVEERKISTPVGLIVDGSSSSTTTTPSHSAASSPSSSSSEQQNLRCPRCDSSNTKFCYYNNYNLTQPRHFCKTCRRYWTKGGALRNVPIGGGCRKTKSIGVSVGSAGKSTAGKAKITLSDAAAVVGKLNLGFGGNGLSDHEISSSPILWSSAQNSHLLALLRSTQISNNTPFQTPNPNPNSGRVKEEGSMIGSHLVPDTTLTTNTLNAHLGQIPIGLWSSLWRNGSTHQYQPQQQQHNNMLFGDGGGGGGSGIQELYQKLRSNYYVDHSNQVLGNGGSNSAFSDTAASTVTTTTATTATATTASILEPPPVTGGEFGYWNLPLAWSDMPATNGAFP